MINGLKLQSYWGGEETITIPGYVYGGWMASFIDCHGKGTASALSYREEGCEMGLAEKLVRQCRKPQGLLGRIIGRAMNTGHAGVRRWGLGYLSEESYAAVLDVGCGGGGALRDMASSFPNAKIYGIDYSQDMVLLAKKVNKRLIETGRIGVTHGSVSSLPFPDGTFELVTAFESYYFWPDLVHDLKEIKRVLKPGGTLLLVNEVYESDKFRDRNAKWAAWADMHLHSPAGFREFLKTAGYGAIEVHEVGEKNWIAAIGKKNE